MAWDSLSDREQRLFARYMEVYAAMVDSIDQSVGRLRDTLAELGELDNTVFIFTSDNGASREGKDKGTTSYFADQAMATEPGHAARQRRGPGAGTLRRHRRPDHVAALPTRLGDGLQHAVPAVQDHHATTAATRCRSSCPGRPASPGATRSCAASTPTSPTCCPPWSTSSA